MECKKTKMSTEYQENARGSRHKQILNLFSKKFVYSKRSHWSLKLTSLYSHFELDVKAQQEQNLPLNRVSCGWNSRNRPDSSVCSILDEKASIAVSEDTEVQTTTSVQHLNNCPHKRNLCLKQENESFHFLSSSSPSSSKKQMCHPFENAYSLRQRQFRKRGIVLPSPWQCETLMVLKEKLNVLKDRLSDKEMIAWHQHTNSTNLAGKVVGEIKNHYNAELCTQAWCKFHEILASHDVVPSSVFSQPQCKFNSIHLCEAPGAFITSLNHYLISRGFNTHEKWRWLGTTLNPYYEGNKTGLMISDDRFIRTTFSNWFFGKDNSGDLMCTDSMLALMELAERMGDIHLITADGSIDCQENPAEQEVIVSRLHHCEVLSSCLLLTPGGTLVIKLFTMFEASSIALVYFLNCVFEKMTVCKPATSKAGNSEVYAVCSGYTPLLPPDALFAIFSAVCSAPEDAQVVLHARKEIPEDFLEEHISCCRYFSELQSDTISQNLELYGKMSKEQNLNIASLQELCVKHYVKVCDIKVIADHNRIRPSGYKSYSSRFTYSYPNQKRPSRASSLQIAGVTGYGSSSVSRPLGRLQGTFQQRQQQNQSSWWQLLEQIPDYAVDDSCMKIKCRSELAEEEVKKWKVKMGREFGTVASSYFCEPSLLGDLKLLLQHAQVSIHQQKMINQHCNTVLAEAFDLLQFCFAFLNHHQHHMSAVPSDIYHVALKDSITSFSKPDSPELSKFTYKKLSSMKNLQQFEEKKPVALVVDVSSPKWLEEEEIQCQTRLLDLVLHVCSTTYSPRGKRLFLYQILCFHNLNDCHYTLLHLLETLRHAFSLQQSPKHKISCTDTVMEKASCSCVCVGNGKDNHVSSAKAISSVGAEDEGKFLCVENLGSDSNENNSIHAELCGMGTVAHVTSRTEADVFSRNITDCSLSETKRGISETGDSDGWTSQNGDPVSHHRHDLRVVQDDTISDKCDDIMACHRFVVPSAAQEIQFSTACYVDDSVKMDSPTSSGESVVSGLRAGGDSAHDQNLLHIHKHDVMIEQDLQHKHFNTGWFKDSVVKRSQISSSTLMASDTEVPDRSVCHGSQDGFSDDQSSSTCNGCHCSVARGAAWVPLEIVPVLEIINDAAFTRFLKTSNRGSISGFLAMMKSAEQDFFSQQQTTSNPGYTT